MPPRTSPRTSARTSPRATTRTSPSAGRFARSSSTPRRTTPSARRTQPSRRGMASGYVQRRRAPQPSGLKGALGGLGGMLPSAGKARGKATPSTKKGKAGGFALLTAAAGFAFSNRDKLTQMIKQRGSKGSSPEAVTPTTPVQPTTNATPPPATPPPATTA